MVCTHSLDARQPCRMIAIMTGHVVYDCYAFTLSVSRANLFSHLDPLCVLPDCYLRLPDLVEHGCCWVIPNNDYVLVGATSLTSLIYTDLPTYVSLRPL